MSRSGGVYICYTPHIFHSDPNRQESGEADMSKKKAIFQLLLCSALWSIAGIFMKWIPWSGFAIASLRSLLAGGVMAVYMGARRLRFTLSRRSVFGGVALCGTLTLFSVANKMTTAANAIVLQFTSPIWIVLLSALFLKKRFRRMDLTAVALTFVGIALFFADGLSGGHAAGDLVALGAGLSFGCYYISLGDCSEAERMSAVELGHILTFLVGLPVLLFTPLAFSWRIGLSMLTLGVLQLGIPYVLLAHASGWCPPLICSLLGALEPLLNPLWVAIFDGEIPGLLALLGGVIVIASIVVWYVRDERMERQHA